MSELGIEQHTSLHAVTAWAGSPAVLRETRIRFGTVYEGDRPTAGGEIIEVAPDPFGVRVPLRARLRTEAGVDVAAGSAVVVLPRQKRPSPAGTPVSEAQPNRAQAAWYSILSYIGEHVLRLPRS